MTTIWKMIAHHTDRNSATTWTRQQGRIAIGWGRVGDLTRYHSKAGIANAIRDKYPDENNAHLGAPSLWHFRHDLEKGDLVILKGTKRGSLVVRIVGGYEHVAGESPLFGDYQNQRAVEVTTYDPDALWIVAGGAPGTNSHQTLVRCARSVDLNAP